MIKEDLLKLNKDFIEISAEHSTNIAFLKKLLAGQISDISIDIPYGQKVAILGDLMQENQHL